MMKLLLVMLTIVASNLLIAQQNNEEKEITNVIYEYEKALNESNVSEVLKLFAPDGVLVLQGAPTLLGSNAIESFYNSLFEVIDFNLKFIVEETVQVSENWAFVRTITCSKTASETVETGHEIFIINKQPDETWAIARYAGSSAK